VERLWPHLILEFMRRDSWVLLTMNRSVLSDEIQFVAPEVNTVGQAENGIQAIDQIQTLEPELVFLNVQSPGGVIRKQPGTPRW
jgi:AmiR/NasT family two-component response regulator